MALVLGERDYKLVTLFTKIAGIFLFAAGTVVLVDQHKVWLALALVLLGTVVTLAPVPMTVLKPDSVDRAEREGELAVDE
jgi:UDP-N-acetylglucosamine transferase subunit ALG13